MEAGSFLEELFQQHHEVFLLLLDVNEHGLLLVDLGGVAVEFLEFGDDGGRLLDDADGHGHHAQVLDVGFEDLPVDELRLLVVELLAHLPEVHD